MEAKHRFEKLLVPGSPEPVESSSESESYVEDTGTLTFGKSSDLAEKKVSKLLLAPNIFRLKYFYNFIYVGGLHHWKK